MSSYFLGSSLVDSGRFGAGSGLNGRSVRHLNIRYYLQGILLFKPLPNNTLTLGSNILRSMIRDLTIKNSTVYNFVLGHGILILSKIPSICL